MYPGQGVAFRAMSRLAEMMRSKALGLYESNFACFALVHPESSLWGSSASAQGLDASNAPTVELSFLEVGDGGLNMAQATASEYWIRIGTGSLTAFPSFLGLCDFFRALCRCTTTICMTCLMAHARQAPR